MLDVAAEGNTAVGLWNQRDKGLWFRLWGHVVSWARDELPVSGSTSAAAGHPVVLCSLYSFWSTRVESQKARMFWNILEHS